jgi:hypothetical protein
MDDRQQSKNLDDMPDEIKLQIVANLDIYNEAQQQGLGLLFANRQWYQLVHDLERQQIAPIIQQLYPVYASALPRSISPASSLLRIEHMTQEYAQVQSLITSLFPVLWKAALASLPPLDQHESSRYFFHLRQDLRYRNRGGDFLVDAFQGLRQLTALHFDEFSSVPTVLKEMQKWTVAEGLQILFIGQMLGRVLHMAEDMAVGANGTAIDYIQASISVLLLCGPASLLSVFAKRVNQLPGNPVAGKLRDLVPSEPTIRDIRRPRLLANKPEDLPNVDKVPMTFSRALRYIQRSNDVLTAQQDAEHAYPGSDGRFSFDGLHFRDLRPSIEAMERVDLLLLSMLERYSIRPSLSYLSEPRELVGNIMSFMASGRRVLLAFPE